MADEKPNRINLITPPFFFIAEEIEVYTVDGQYKMAVGKEGGCSYFTKVVIIKADKAICDAEIKELRKQLMETLLKEEEQSGSQGE